MRILKLASLALVVLLAIPLGHRTVSAGEDFPAVPPEDLALKDNPHQPGSDAMILYRQAVINEQDSSYDEIMRIKIFTEAGKENGNVKLYFYRNQSDMNGIKARTILPNGTIIPFDGKIFERVVVKAGGTKELAKTFSLPQVVPGCIIDYRYHEQFEKNYLINMSWTITENLYTRFASFSVKPYEAESRSLSVPPLLWRGQHLTADLKPVPEKGGAFSLNVTDVPGLAVEPFMPPEDSLRAEVTFFYKSLSVPVQETTAQYWDRIGKQWNDDLDKYLNKKGALQDVVAQTIQPGDPPEVKLQKLYARAQQIRNVQYEPTASQQTKHDDFKNNQNVEDVLKRGYGTGYDVNALFIGMARTAGFDASLLYVRARNTGVFLPVVQDTTELNAEIVSVRLPSNEYFLDPASKYFPFGLLPWYEASAGGVRMSKKGGELVTTPQITSAQGEKDRMLAVQLDPDGALSGTLTIIYQKERAALLRDALYQDDDAGRRKTLTDDIKKELPSSATLEITALKGWDDINAPVEVDTRVTIPGYAASTGTRLLLPASAFADDLAQSFSATDRVNHIFFHFAWQTVDKISIQLPSGVVAQALPGVRSVPHKNVGYDFSATQTGADLEVHRDVEVGAPEFNVKYYSDLRAFFQYVKAGDSQQVILKATSASANN
jgi:hypothetical protein